jgi:hypothetical protein
MAWYDNVVGMELYENISTSFRNITVRNITVSYVTIRYVTLRNQLWKQTEVI